MAQGVLEVFKTLPSLPAAWPSQRPGEKCGLRGFEGVCLRGWENEARGKLVPEPAVLAGRQSAREDRSILWKVSSAVCSPSQAVGKPA